MLLNCPSASDSCRAVTSNTIIWQKWERWVDRIGSHLNWTIIALYGKISIDSVPICSIGSSVAVNSRDGPSHHDFWGNMPDTVPLTQQCMGWHKNSSRGGLNQYVLHYISGENTNKPASRINKYIMNFAITCLICVGFIFDIQRIWIIFFKSGKLKLDMELSISIMETKIRYGRVRIRYGTFTHALEIWRPQWNALPDIVQRMRIRLFGNNPMYTLNYLTLWILANGDKCEKPGLWK